MAFLRRLVAVSLATLFAFAGTTLAVSTAEATPPHPAHTSTAALAPSYSYWGYYTWDDAKSTWAFSTVGANDPKTLPEDGDVFGFRWALVVKDPRLPRADGNFDSICGTTAAGDGEKRVAFVLDYGTDADAAGSDSPPPARGACAVVEQSFTTQQALQTVAEVRVGDSGLICGVDGYPSEGCGETVKNAEEPPADEPVQLVMPGAEEPDGTTDGSDQADDPDGEETTAPAGGSDADVVDPSQDTSEAGEDEGGVSFPLLVAGVVILALAAGALVMRKRG